MGGKLFFPCKTTSKAGRRWPSQGEWQLVCTCLGPQVAGIVMGDAFCQRRLLNVESLISMASAFQAAGQRGQKYQSHCFLSTRWSCDQLCGVLLETGGLVALPGPDQPQTPTSLYLLVIVYRPDIKGLEMTSFNPCIMSEAALPRFAGKQTQAPGE